MYARPAIVIALTAVLMLLASCPLEPVQTYTVVYNGNGATSGTAPSAQTQTHGVPLTLATNSGNLQKTGHSFAGWNTQVDGTGTDYAEGAHYTAETDLTLYAKWLRTCHNVTLTYVEGGSYQRDSDELNITTVSGFHMSVYEITRAQFQVIMGTDPSNTTYSTGTSDPVQTVNWYHAIAFCNKLSMAEGKELVYGVTGIDWVTLEYVDIPTISNAIRAAYHPVKAVHYGSCARGDQ